jgi:azurin
MDLTGGESQNWMGHGYVKAASSDGDDVNITGRAGTLPDDV